MPLKSLCFAVVAFLLSTTNLFADIKQAAPASKPPAKPLAKVATAPDAAKIEAIKEMLAVSGTVHGNVEAAHASIKAMTKNSPGISSKFWKELEKTVNDAVFEQLLVGVYDRNYTLDEVRAITEFYVSPAGRVFLEKNGPVLAESGRILQTYMESNSKELMKKFGQTAQGVDPQKK